MHSSSLVLSADDRATLERRRRLPTTSRRDAFRAQVILAVADGMTQRTAARFLRCRRPTVAKWVRRYRGNGINGLGDAKRPGRPRRITATERCSVIAAACSQPEDAGLAGITEWSGSLLAEHLRTSGRVARISARTVQRILARAVMKPHRCDYWKRATDPAFDEKMRPIIDLYLHPPADGPVWCADEKTSIQALQRRFPDLPLRRPGERAKREAEYIRHGTRCLTAGLEVRTGKVIGIVTPNRPAPIFIKFLDRLDAEVPKGQVIHLILDNLNTHKGPPVKAWQEAHPGRLQIHYLPFYASWLNQIEMWFGTIQRRLIRRGDFVSGDQLEQAILNFIATYNRLHAHPYRWNYTGEPLVA
jgi:transposase